MAYPNVIAHECTNNEVKSTQIWYVSCSEAPILELPTMAELNDFFNCKVTKCSVVNLYPEQPGLEFPDVRLCFNANHTALCKRFRYRLQCTGNKRKRIVAIKLIFEIREIPETSSEEQYISRFPHFKRKNTFSSRPDNRFVFVLCKQDKLL